MRNKSLLMFGLIVIGAGAFALGLTQWKGKIQWIKPIPDNAPEAMIENSYEKYAFENLIGRDISGGKIETGRILQESETYTSYVFYYSSEGKRISGWLNIPSISGPRAVIVMARGYVEKEGYETGMGTKNAAAYYASHGYITLAPDFSGYGESDPEDENALGARLKKPVEILDLLLSLQTLPQADDEKIYLWGHSNGGQIMLSVAEILGREPRGRTPRIKGVTLWAPVSKPFPYSILYYTDEADDKGKWLRREISRFESDYDVYRYSVDRYLDWIEAPVLIHQGEADDAVPIKWSDELAEALKKKEKDVTYLTYPGTDHNMRPNWGTVVARDVAWFASLKEE